MASNVYTKDPDETLDYRIDWSRWLEAGDLITSSQWIVPSGIVKSSEAIPAARSTVIWLTGGTLGQNYTLTNRITTVAGRITDRSIVVRVRSK